MTCESINREEKLTSPQESASVAYWNTRPERILKVTRDVWYRLRRWEQQTCDACAKPPKEMSVNPSKKSDGSSAPLPHKVLCRISAADWVYFKFILLEALTLSGHLSHDSS